MHILGCYGKGRYSILYVKECVCVCVCVCCVCVCVYVCVCVCVCCGGGHACHIPWTVWLIARARLHLNSHMNYNTL